MDDDLQTLREQRPEVAGPTEDTLQRMRAQIAARTTGSASRPPRLSNLLDLRRRVWIPAVAALLTAAVVVVAAVVTRDSGTTLAGSGDASAILHRAVGNLESQASSPVQVPRPDQWLYQKVDRYQVDPYQRQLEQTTSEEWISVDYQRVAWRNENGELVIKDNELETPEPDPLPYDPRGLYELYASLPDDTNALVETIYDLVNKRVTIRCREPLPSRSTQECEAEYSTPVQRDRSAFELINGLLHRGLPPADVQAKLFRALAEIPGLQADGTVQDGVDEEAVAIAWNHQLDTRADAVEADERLQILLDPGTSTYRGYRILDYSLAAEDGNNLAGGAFFVGGIVDEPGQVP